MLPSFIVLITFLNETTKITNELLCCKNSITPYTNEKLLNMEENINPKFL